jgi:cation transport regulator ChaB
MEQAYNDKVDRKRNKRNKRKRKLVAWAIIENRYYESDIYFDSESETFDIQVESYRENM